MRHVASGVVSAGMLDERGVLMQEGRASNEINPKVWAANTMSG